MPNATRMVTIGNSHHFLLVRRKLPELPAKFDRLLGSRCVLEIRHAAP